MRQYTIIVPVFNQRELVMRCLDSVRRNTPPGHTLVIVDDASTDRRLAAELSAFRLTRANSAVMTRETNGGFVQSANVGLTCAAIAGTDVILLNSDTEVPPGWLERLDHARDAAAISRGLRVAAINPLSNDATLYSVPGAGTNKLPAWLSTDQMDQVAQNVARSSSTRVPYPETPTAVGFCMLMTREALDAVGELDTAFGRGYGEEVDWCQRARAAGFACVLCDDLFVWHQGHASFGDTPERTTQRLAAVEMVRERWPEYENEVKAWWLDAHLREQRIRIADAIRPRPAYVGKPRKLWVAHSYHAAGGVEIAVRQRVLADRMHEHVVVWPRCPWQTDGEVYVDADGTLCLTMSPELVAGDVTVDGYPLVDDQPRVRKWFAAMLQAVGPSAVSFHHFAGWGAIEDLARLAESCVGLDAVSVFAHDEHPLCPAFRLGGECDEPNADGGAKCHECINAQVTCTAEVNRADVASRAARHVTEWQAVAERYGVVAPSVYLAGQLLRGLGVVADVDPPRAPLPVLARVRVPSERVRVAWVGRATLAKGWATFAAFAALTKDLYELHVIGGLAAECDCTGLDHVRFHGTYVREELACWLQRVDIAVPALNRNEAYGQVVGECDVAGVEVVCANVDAAREQVGGDVVTYAWGNVESLRAAVAAVAHVS